MEEELKVREVELVGGPPWGLRIAAATTTTTIVNVNILGEDNKEGETGGGMKVVGAVKIARVNPESKASNAGLRDGDLILSVNGEQVQVPQPIGAVSSASNSSQSPSQDQHHRILGQLNGDRVRLSVLSKKSKSAKKLQKALAKGEFEQQQQSSKGSSSCEVKVPGASVQWADGQNTRKILNNTQTDLDDNDNTENQRIKKTDMPNLDMAQNEGGVPLGQLGQDIPSDGREPPSASSKPSPANLLSDIIDELQLAANTTAKFLSDMEAHLQEEVDQMQPGLLRQVSASSPAASSSTSMPIPYPSSLLIKQEDLQPLQSNGSSSFGGSSQEEIPPIWSPPGVPPSPKLGKKFRPVTFNANAVPSSPVLVNQNGISTPTSPAVGVLSPTSPSERSELSVTRSLENNSSKPFSSSQSSTTTTTGGSNSNLPKYQNPTMVLLQKAREGHLPKGAAYLQQQPPSPTTSSSDTRISSVNFNLNQPNRMESNETAISSYGATSHPPPLPKIRPYKSASSTEIINIPTTSKSALTNEKEQRLWYKRMYESLHVEKKTLPSAKCTYPAGRIKTGPPMKSFWAKRTHSNGTMSEPEDFDHPDEEEYDFNKFGSKVLSPVGSGSGRPTPPGAIRFYNPGRIEDYNPAGGTCTSAARKQRYHRQMQPDMKRHWALSSPKSSGYESDSNYIIRKRTETDSAGIRTPEPPPLSPAEQRNVYLQIHKGGEVPLQGLRKYVPGPGRSYDDHGDEFRTASPSQNIRYSESSVNIHYRAPVRIEEKEYVSEEELRKRQQQAMKLFYEEQRKQKYLKEIEDMERRRHSDNFAPSHKSPIPLNRYEDGDVIDGLIDNTPPRPGSGGLWQRMTPEPMTASMKNGVGSSGPPLAIARAKFNFTAQSPKELQLVKGDLIFIRRKIDANWYEGELRQHGKNNSYFYPNGGGTNPLGIFPCTYVEILPDDPTSSATLAKYSSGSSRDSEGLARVLFNFHPSHSFELELVKGELIILTKKVDNNWFEGKKQKNPVLSGILPISYVDVIKEIGASTGSKSPAFKKPVGQPVVHSLSYGADMDDFSLKKHHYKPNEFVLQDDSDYGEVFSPLPNKNDRNARNKRRMNQRLELITIDTRLNNDQPFRYRAIYNYRPVHRDELELKEGDIVEVLEKCDDGWFVGTSQRTGLFGTFPGNYVERV